MTQIDWLLSHGFNERGEAYCVYGDDTYSIKEWLKEQGCKFSPIFKWYSATEFELPEGYKFLKISYKTFMKWDTAFDSMLFYEDAKARFERLVQELQGPSTAQYYAGSEGDRVRHVTAVFKSHRGFQGQFGYTNIFTFEAGDAVLVWFTTTEQEDIEVGDVVDLSFTIKKFEEFRGVKTTQISRAKVVKIGE